MKFKKGDTVIYPQHGACIVHGIKRMKAFGAVQEYLILKTVINEMTLSVPTAMANQVGVRPPVSKSELEDLRSVLSKADPRVPAELAKAPHSGTGDYGKALKQLAVDERCAYLDLTTPWADFIRSSKLHPHLFFRDAVHANEYGEQILS